MSGLRTDVYELRMAASYLRRGMTGQATFSLFVRDLPRNRGFLVAAGLADCLDFLEGFVFSDSDLRYLGDGLGLTGDAVRRLAELRFTGDVWAVPEGRVVLAGEPLLEVTAPIAEAQLVETALLNEITFQTAVATKAARCRIAARDAAVVDFAARRTHGWEAALRVARASAIAGFDATSNTEASRRYRIPGSGTMAHSYVEAFPDESAAFRAFAADYPETTVFLVDTYDTVAGVSRAIAVAREFGLRDVAVRLDSGDLATMAIRARAMLDDAGLRSASIIASGGLDEFDVADLVAAGAPIDAFGIGTKMGVSADAPSLDSAYKLVEYADRPVMKLSLGKLTMPGRKQVFRGDDPGDGDLLALRDEPAPAGRSPLLEPVLRNGRRVRPPEPWNAARARFEHDLAWLPAAARRIVDPVPVPVRPTARLTELTESVRAHGGGHPATPAGASTPARP